MQIRRKELSLNVSYITAENRPLLVSHNYLGVDTIHFVFLEISGSLNWSAMSQISPLHSQATNSVLFHFLCQFYQAIIMAIQVSSFVSWKKDCNLSNFATKAFLVSCYLEHRFLTGEIHSTVITKIKWSWPFFGADHQKVPNRPQNA